MSTTQFVRSTIYVKKSLGKLQKLSLEWLTLFRLVVVAGVHELGYCSRWMGGLRLRCEFVNYSDLLMQRSLPNVDVATPTRRQLLFTPQLLIGRAPTMRTYLSTP